MIRHALASIHAPTARALGIPTTLTELAVQLDSQLATDLVGRRGSPRPAAVALTFDDGPHPQGTPAILNLLDDHGARATFFVVGEQVQRWPEIVRETVARGHQIALHGFRHRLQSRLSSRQLGDDIARGVAAIEDAIGQTPALHRPPYGIYAPAGLRIVRERGLQPLLWARWGKDWRRLTTPTRISRRVVRDLHSGDVILLHDADHYSAKDSHERTARALELILTALQSRETGTVLPV